MAIDTLGANALASNSVTTAKIAADAVTSAKIPAGAVVVSDIADDSVTTAKIADDAITQALIAAGAVGNTEVASGISAAKLTTGTLPNAQMPSGSMLQVIQTTATSVHNYGGSTGWSNPSSYNVTITPSSTSNKVMVFYNIWGICYNNAKHLTWDLLRNVGGSVGKYVNDRGINTVHDVLVVLRRLARLHGHAIVYKRASKNKNNTPVYLYQLI